MYHFGKNLDSYPTEKNETKKMQHITLIAGARPNFVKIAPLIHAIKKAQDNGAALVYRLVHTGQHYDKNMSDSFFEELNIPKPDVNLACGGGSQAEQTASIMVAFENDLRNHPTELVVVVGDVTSTMACSIVAKKMNTKVAHVEAGIRSYDLSMPEEINRMVTDAIADYFFTTTHRASNNLLNSGIDASRIFFVGNVMIDTLLANMQRFRKPNLFEQLELKEKKYLMLTLHRPANVDEIEHLKKIMNEIVQNAQYLPIIFPIHPRTAKLFVESGITASNLHIVAPMGYLEFNYMVKHSLGVITDSGGITEETTVMGIPCITLRDNTERPETCEIGTNELIGTNPENIAPTLNSLFSGKWKSGSIPELWDGKTAERIVKVLIDL